VASFGEKVPNRSKIVLALYRCRPIAICAAISRGANVLSLNRFWGLQEFFFVELERRLKFLFPFLTRFFTAILLSSFVENVGVKKHDFFSNVEDESKLVCKYVQIQWLLRNLHWQIVGYLLAQGTTGEPYVHQW
jgi:hypothetical protein